MKKRMTLMLLAVALVFGGIFGFKAFVNSMMTQAFDNMPQPPATVSTATAQTMRWAPRLGGVGSVVADQSIQLSAEVGGRVTAIHFQSGALVEAGAVLLEMDAALDRAELDSLQTQLALARTEYERIATLYRQQRVSKSERDAARAERDALAAQAAAREATLAKKTLRAPFAGRVGIRQVSLGQVLQPGEAVVELSSREPMHVDFTLPAQQLGQLREGLPVQVALRAGAVEALPGRITALASSVDAQTRYLTLRATLERVPDSLLPGLFADVTVLLPEQRERVVVPQAAVQFNPYGDTVFVVVREQGEGEGGGEGAEPQPVAKQRFVQTGEARGDFVAITEGLEAGEEVITTGQLKVRNGSALVIDNDNAPTPEQNPTPANS